LTDEGGIGSVAIESIGFEPGDGKGGGLIDGDFSRECGLEVSIF
jgi:hypothetical protein